MTMQQGRYIREKKRAQLKIRLLEPLRHQIEQAAYNNNRSMNLEIVVRLTASFDEGMERWPS